MGLLKAIIGLILINIVIFGGYFVYQNYLAGEIEQLNILNYNPNIEESLVNVSTDLEQFYENMRFNHNEISYYINPNCPTLKRSKMLMAFKEVEEMLENRVTFKNAQEEKADILVGCSFDSYEKEENIFVAGEGGPTRIVNSSMPVITKGKILLYSEERSKCDEPVLELHELLHVFGYDHINNEKYIMHPYLNCNQKINSELVNHMRQLYSIEPFSELYFEDVSAYKERYAGKWYLNFNVSVSNIGIIDAENVLLQVYADDSLVEIFELDDNKFGGGENFYVKNLLLSPQSAESIKFILITSTKENNKGNNVLELTI
jgi:predicted Zn-dependent protease